jgi:hypothetical protein
MADESCSSSSILSMIARNITKSKKVQQLSDTQRVIYAFILPFLDREGRINAHPTYLKGLVFLHLEYTEAEIGEAIRKMHDVGLVTVYATEDDVVMQFKDFLVYNKPNHKESESEYPAPVGDTPSGTEEKVPPGNAPEMPGQCAGNAGGEVEVEVEVEVEKEVEAESTKKNNVSSLMTPPTLSEEAATDSEEVSKRQQSFDLIKSKLKNTPEGYDLLSECLEDDYARTRWFDLSPDEIKTIIRDATRFKTPEKGFKTTLIGLLDKKAIRQSQHAAAAPPSSRGTPTPGSIQEAFRVLRGDALKAFLESPDYDRLREEEREAARKDHPDDGDRLTN